MRKLHGGQGEFSITGRKNRRRRQIYIGYEKIYEEVHEHTDSPVK